MFGMNTDRGNEIVKQTADAAIQRGINYEVVEKILDLLSKAPGFAEAGSGQVKWQVEQYMHSEYLRLIPEWTD